MSNVTEELVKQNGNQAAAVLIKFIPPEASPENQLADKDYVNRNISTASATFRGTSATGLTQQQFLAWANTLEHDLNDYVFWDTTDAGGNEVFKRYKWDGTQWAYEFTLTEGTDNYNELRNRPLINGYTLAGNKTALELGLADRVFEGTRLAEKIECDTFYNFGNLVATGESVEFMLGGAPTDRSLHFWMWMFHVGDDGVEREIILPRDLQWVGGIEPTIEPNQTYLFIVIGGLAMCFSTASGVTEQLIRGILFGLQDGLPSLRVEELTIARKLDAYIKEGNALTSGAGAPNILPQFNGQEYFDTTNKVWYKASYTGTEPTASAWKQITN